MRVWPVRILTALMITQTFALETKITLEDVRWQLFPKRVWGLVVGPNDELWFVKEEDELRNPLEVIPEQWGTGGGGELSGRPVLFESNGRV
ncbi:MAG: hypothetical protein ACI8W8_000909 [Rhodothermales bacterium]|jgi:hypothetical protein